MAQERSIKVSLELLTDKFSKNTEQAQKKTNELSKGMKLAFKTIKLDAVAASGGVLLIAAAAKKAGETLVEVFKASTQHIRDLKTQSEESGKSISELSNGLLTDKDVAVISLMDSELEELQNTLLSLSANFISVFAPAIIGFTAAANDMLQTLDTSKIESFLRGFAEVPTGFGTAINNLLDAKEDYSALGLAKQEDNRLTKLREVVNKARDRSLGIETPADDPLIAEAKKLGATQIQLDTIQLMLDKEKERLALIEEQKQAAAEKEAAEKKALADKIAAEKKAADDLQKAIEKKAAEQKKEYESNQKAADDLIRSNQTDLENYAEKLKEINALKVKGFLSEEDAKQIAERELNKSFAKVEREVTEVDKLNSANIVGTKGFFERLQQAKNPNEKVLNKTEENTRKTREAAEKLLDKFSVKEVSF